MANNKVSIEIELLDRISGNLDRVNRKMDEMGRQSQSTRKELDALDGVSDKLKRSLAALGLAFSMKEMVGKIVSVRGEMQQLQVAFETMLGSAQKANALMSQLVNTAATTPFGLEDVANGAKQLLAYGTEAEKVNETLIRLGDIAAGLSVPLNDLVYLYGTTMAQGRLYTQDLNQFTGRGIPMIQELAKQFGVAESKVKELVESGKVGFPEVQKVIESLTDEGSKFGGLMEAQSKTITGQIANIEDTIDMMLNDIGQQQEGIINGVLSNVSYMIEHYEQFGRILLGLAATWGTYRTAVMVAAAAIGWTSAAEAIHYNWLLLVEKAQKLLNATMLANPYVLVATAIASVVAVMVSMKSETERMKEIDEAYEAEKQKVIEAEEEHRRRMEELIEVAGDESLSTDTRRAALVELIQQYPEVFAKYKTEYDMLKHIRDIKLEIAEIDGEKTAGKAQEESRQLGATIAKIRQELQARKTGSNTSHVSEYVGMSTQKLMDMEKAYSQRKAAADKSIRQNAVKNYLSNLTGVSNKDLEKQIRERENLLAKMTVTGLKKGRVQTDGAAGTYTKDELQGQLQLLRAEQTRRNAPRKSSDAWGEEAKKAYQKALKEYNDFINTSSNKLTQEEYEKQAKTLKEKVGTAKKEYDKTKPSTDKDADKAAKAEEKRRRAKEKLGQELTALQRENDASEIEVMEDGTEKKLLQIENDYQRRKDEIEKQRADWKNENKKAGMATGDDGLTDEQRTALGDAEAQAEKARVKAIEDANREALQNMYDYIAQYGSLEQQKLALTEKYEAQIAKEPDKWKKKTLERERDKALSAITYENISMGIDWQALMSGVGTMSKDMLRPMLEQLEAYVKTDEYLGAGAETQQKVSDLMKELRQYLGTDGNATWRELGAAIEQFNTAVGTYQRAVEAEKAANARLQKAKSDLKSGKITQTEYDAIRQEAERLGEATASAQETMGKFGTALNDASDKVGNFVSGLTASLNNLKGWKGAEGFSSVQSAVSGFDTLKGDLDSLLPTLSDGLGKSLGTSISGVLGSGLSSIGSGITSVLGTSLGSVVGIIAQIPQLILNIINAIKNFITGILDAISELLSFEWLSDLVNSILNAVGNLIDTILDLPENLWHVLSSIVVEGIGGLLNTVIGRLGNILSFGALSSAGPADWFTNDNAKAVAETSQRLADENELLRKSVDQLKDEMANLGGDKLLKSSELAIKKQKRIEENLQEDVENQAGYHSAHHSWGYYWNKRGGFTQDELAYFSELLGHQWDGDIYNMSSEDAEKLVIDERFRSIIEGTGKGGYGSSVLDKMEALAENSGEMQDLINQINEGFTQVSFDDLRSSFIDTLMDMDASAEDFADNFSEYMMRAVLNAQMSNFLEDDLQAFYTKWTEYSKNGITEDNIKELREDYNKIVDQGLKKRDEAAQITGYTGDSGTTQSGKSGAFTTMTQDQGTKLEGMFTSGLQHWSSMDARMETVVERMATAESHLARIAENTGNSAASVGELKEEFKKMMRDGLKVK